MNKGFPHQPSELSAFAVTLDIFVICLKNGEIVQHTPEDATAFYDWLKSSDVREVTTQTKELCL